MRAWALRDSESKLYLAWGKRLRKNSHAEFTSVDAPRLFSTKRAASNAKVAWMAGKWRFVTSGNGDDVDVYVEPRSIDGRKDRKIEVVEFLLQETEAVNA